MTRLPPDIEHALVARLGAPGSVDVVDHRSHTSLYRIRLPAGDGDGWIKQYRSKPGDAVREYRFLSECHALLDQKRELHLAVPVVLLEDCGAIVTRHIDGQCLSAWLRLADGRFATAAHVERVEDAARRCGHGLANLQQCTTGPIRQCRLEGVAEWIDGWLARHRSLPGFGRSRQQEFRALVGVHAAGAHRAVRTHGDFGPHNVILSPSGPVLMDPAFPDELPSRGEEFSAFDDLARFRRSILGNTRGSSRSSRRRAWARAFLEGYERGTGQPLEPEALVLFDAYQLLLSMQDNPGWMARLTRGRSHGLMLASWLAEARASC